MTPELLERLIYEGESPSLDFKRDQYAFNNSSSDTDRCEILKDILHFANGWRRTEAYIVIGIGEPTSDPASVVGITDHLNDHSLQPFVTTRTNQPVRFHYETIQFRGVSIGVICFDKDQPRPVYLKKDFGTLRQQAVYVRRGTCNDPMRPATPEEIAAMGKGLGVEEASITVEWADLRKDISLGNSVSFESEFCRIPKIEEIPDYQTSSGRRGPFGNIYFESFLKPTNPNFVREYAFYELSRRLCRPVRLLIRNDGQVAARAVHLEIAIPADDRFLLCEDKPEKPSSTANPFGNVELRRPIVTPAGTVEIDTNEHRSSIKIVGGDIQPGRVIMSEVFYIGKVADGQRSIRGQVFAENLPRPKDFALTIDSKVTETALALDELWMLAINPQ